MPPDQICPTIKSFQLGWAFLDINNTIPKSFFSFSQFYFGVIYDILWNDMEKSYQPFFGKSFKMDDFCSCLKD